MKNQPSSVPVTPQLSPASEIKELLRLKDSILSDSEKLAKDIALVRYNLSKRKATYQCLRKGKNSRKMAEFYDSNINLLKEFIKNQQQIIKNMKTSKKNGDLDQVVENGLKTLENQLSQFIVEECILSKLTWVDQTFDDLEAKIVEIENKMRSIPSFVEQENQPSTPNPKKTTVKADVRIRRG